LPEVLDENATTILCDHASTLDERLAEVDRHETAKAGETLGFHLLFGTPAAGCAIRGRRQGVRISSSTKNGHPVYNQLTMDSELGWKDAISEVLRNEKSPMHYTDIAEQIFERRLRTEPSATPANTVAAVIAMSLKSEGELSPFIRVSRGVYDLRGAQPTTPVVESELSQIESEVTGLINAFGMFWDRSRVRWETEPRILGQQQSAAKPVDFCGQRGVYLLHDPQGVVYVGRTTDQSMGRRLQQHTSDRLTGRWTRFSWFGLYPVESDGSLKTSADFSTVPINIVIATMEAVLIEGLEPRQNRKRGDDFKAIEFLQVEDPRLEMNRKLAVMQELAAQLKSE
jgi:hypothetical protein